MNNEPTDDTHIYLPAKKSLRRTLLAWGVIIATAVACGWALVAMANQRFSVVGSGGDSGCTIRYTINKRYQARKEVVHRSADSDAAIEEREYLLPPPSSAKLWIYKYLLRRNYSTTGYTGNADAHSIRQTYFTGARNEGVQVDSSGYAQLTDLNDFGKVQRERRFLINGDLATWSVVDVNQFPGSGGTLRFYVLLVKPQDRSVIFSFVGVDDTHEPNETLDEMLEIQNSVKIVKDARA